MILKVAVGVFLGIIAVLVVLRIPTWMRENREYEASIKLSHTTPDDVIARCGKSLKDESETLPTNNPKQPLVQRWLFYKGRFSDTVAVQFTQFYTYDGQKAWSVPTVKAVIGSDDHIGTRTYLKAADTIFELPCLDPGNER